jgi:hypothetical protein
MSHVRFTAALAVWTAAAAAPVAATALPYAWDIPDGQRISYSVQIDVEHPGPLSVAAEWDGGRVLAFRIEAPGGRAAVRRSGPSPQRLEVEVDPDGAADPRPWTLRIIGLAANGGGAGRMTIDVPDPPAPARPAPALPEAPAAAQPRMSPDSPAAWLRFERTTERFLGARSEPAAPDACRWQADFAAYLMSRRAELLGSGELPSDKTEQVLRGIVRAIRRVDELRAPDDPALAGPVPREPAALRAWLRERQRRIEALEAELDAVQRELRRQHAPQLSDERWPSRLISCLTACERHFDERVLYGERKATNLELARVQWEPILAAAEALDALVACDDGAEQAALP